MRTMSEAKSTEDSTEIDAESCFYNALAEGRFEDAVNDPDIFIGNSRGEATRNLVTYTGLFGRTRYTDEPNNVEVDDWYEAKRTIQAVCRGAQDAGDIAKDVYEYDFGCDYQVQFPSEMGDVRFGRPEFNSPFGSMRFEIYVNEDYNRYEPLKDAIVKELEDAENLSLDIRAVEFDFGEYTFEEQFRTVYPWAKYGEHLDNFESDETFDLPRPVNDQKRSLHNAPHLPEHRRLTLFVHYHSNKYDDDAEFTEENTAGLDGNYRIVESDAQSELERSLDNATVHGDNLSMQYTLSLSVDREDAQDAIESEQGVWLRVNTTDDYARVLAEQHHKEEYNGADAQAGVLECESTEDEEVVYTMTVTA